MDSGQIKTGDGPQDTYIKILDQMPRLTPSMAYGIAAEFPSVQALVKGLQENGALALEDCRKSANKDGAFTDRRVGQAISRRVHRVFLGRNEMSTDV
jgi:crossover junction endonuclease EME1